MLRNEFVIFQYEYQAGPIIFPVGTLGSFQKEMDGKIQISIGAIHYMIPEVYLVSANEYKKLPNQ